MSKVSQIQLNNAFEVIIQAFQEVISDKIVSVKGISFVIEDQTRDDDKNAEEHKPLASSNSAFHGFTTQECIRRNGRWICPRPR